MRVSCNPKVGSGFSVTVFCAKCVMSDLQPFCYTENRESLFGLCSCYNKPQSHDLLHMLLLYSPEQSSSMSIVGGTMTSGSPGRPTAAYCCCTEGKIFSAIASLKRSIL